MSRGLATLFSFDYPPLTGGISRLCSELAAGLARRGMSVGVLSQGAPSSGPAAPPEPVSETRVTRLRPFREMAAFRRMRALRGGGPVICGLWYPEGLIAALAGARPLVILAHGSELLPAPLWRRGLWRRLLRWALSRADLIVANSSYTKGLVESASPGCKAAAVPLAVDHRRFTPEGRAGAKVKLGVEGKLVLSTVSRLKAYKGHGTVFRALAMLPEAVRSAFVYLVAGKGPDRALLEREADRLGVAPQVRWLGFVSEEELPGLYRASDLFALCTREDELAQEVEGFGLVFLEAQACGTPVVGTRTGGIPDAVSDGEGGWLIAQDDHEALAGILARLAGSPGEFEAQGRSGRARVEREFTWDRYMERFVAELSARGIELG